MRVMLSPSRFGSVAWSMLFLMACSVDAAELTVNSITDNTVAMDGQVTLREAIIAANTDSMTDLGQSGLGADVIDVGLLSGTMALNAMLPPITTTIRIAGVPGALTISGSDGNVVRSRVLFIDGGDLALTGLRFADGAVRGGNGASSQQRTGGGGGAAGIGALIFLNAGSVAIERCELAASEARGGDGGSREFSAGDGGGGGGGGIGGDGSPRPPTTLLGGVGGPGTPLPGVGGAMAMPGGEGAGGGGGRFTNAPTAENPGGDGGVFGGGGGGGQKVDPGQLPPTGGAGGFGAGGGGRGGGDASGDGVGGAAGQFGGAGAASSSQGNIAGGGGGGAGLGGCIFARSGSLKLQSVLFTNCTAFRGLAGTNSQNLGGNGAGKGGAIFVGDAANAQAHALTFSLNDATDSVGSGYTPGQASDTDDVYGVIAEYPLLLDGFEN